MRSLQISSLGGSMILDGSQGVTAGLRFRGSGLPPVALQWFEGAGDGASFRGGRTLSRVLDVPVTIRGVDRAAVNDSIGRLGRIVALRPEPARLVFNAGDESWGMDVVRTGGGDWTWGQDTDGSTFAKIVLTFQGDPFWESEDEEARLITLQGLGLGLLGAGRSLATLTVSDMDGVGSASLENTGDVEAYPTWTLYAPFTGFTLTSPRGEALQWTGTAPKAGGYIEVNTEDGTVKDETGANRYAELATAPKFWAIPRGLTAAGLALPGASGSTYARVVWRPRRLAVF